MAAIQACDGGYGHAGIQEPLPQERYVLDTGYRGRGPLPQAP
ncbi:MAG: hypothetical protein RLY77_297 [Pseudomonadota bacterium]|jgi:hypothetical protein